MSFAKGGVVAFTAALLVSVASVAAIIWGIFQLLGGGTDELVLPRTCDGGAERCWAVFAMGCFWCAESDYEKFLQAAVGDVISGYTGGKSEEPTHKSHLPGGHYEAIAVPYNPRLVTYEVLLLWFWQNVDYADDGGQFCDRGVNYRPAVFALNEAQRAAAEHSKSLLVSQSTFTVRTPVLPASRFWIAEEYHQDYYEKESSCYQHYHQACGRDRRLRELRGEHIFRPMVDWAAGPNMTWRNESEAAFASVDSHQAHSTSGFCNVFSMPGPLVAVLVVIISSCLLICAGWYMTRTVWNHMYMDAQMAWR